MATGNKANGTRLTTDAEATLAKARDLLGEAATLFEIRGCIRMSMADSDPRKRFLSTLADAAHRSLLEGINTAIRGTKHNKQ